MAEVDVSKWAEAAAGESRQAWQTVQADLHGLGLGNAYFIFDYPLFNSGFPEDNQLIGTVVSEEWKTSCKTYEGDIGWRRPSDVVPRTASLGRKQVFRIARIIKNPETTRKQAETLSMVLDCGAKVGYSLPVVDRVRKTFSVMMIDGVGSAKNYTDLVEQHESELWRGVIYFHEGMVVRELAKSMGRNPLSPREQDCLAWSAAGRSAKQIADSLRLAESTVNEYLRSACKKLGATNKTQAAARAVLLHFLEP